MYTGKGTVVNERGLGVGGEVVVRLLRDIPNGLNYKCFFDNWFTSPELLAARKQMGIGLYNRTQPLAWLCLQN